MIGEVPGAQGLTAPSMGARLSVCLGQGLSEDDRPLAPVPPAQPELTVYDLQGAGASGAYGQPHGSSLNTHSQGVLSHTGFCQRETWRDIGLLKLR